MFFAINMLNNWAFAFKISVPVHIILRSFGSVTTMIAGWLRGKRYSRIQVLSVVLLTIGVLVAAWADASSKVCTARSAERHILTSIQGKPMSTNNINFTDPSFEAGLLILLIAQLLSAYMGAYVEDIYAEHGNYWHENLFYSHFLSLPLFLPLQPTLQRQYVRLAASPPLAQNTLALSVLPSAEHSYFGQLPEAVFFLLANAALQLLCISGVNLLSAKSSAVTVTIVLNIRKLVSFILSIVLFGNKMSAQMIVGAAMVFGAGTLYGLETTYWMPARKKKTAKEGDKKAQ